MRQQSIFSNPYLAATLTLLTGGLWGLLWLVYFSFKLKSINIFYFAPFFIIVFSSALILDFGPMITLLILSQWFAIPHKIAELRLHSRMDPKISWKLGLFPFLAHFYTIGFISFYAPSHSLSDEMNLIISTLLSLSALIAMAIWVFISQKRYNEFLDYNEEQRLNSYYKRTSANDDVS